MSFFFTKKRISLLKVSFSSLRKHFSLPWQNFFYNLQKNCLRNAKYFFDKTKYSLIRQNFHRIEGFFYTIEIRLEEIFLVPECRVCMCAYGPLVHLICYFGGIVILASGVRRVLIGKGGAQRRTEFFGDYSL